MDCIILFLNPCKNRATPFFQGHSSTDPRATRQCVRQRNRAKMCRLSRRETMLTRTIRWRLGRWPSSSMKKRTENVSIIISSSYNASRFTNCNCAGKKRQGVDSGTVCSFGLLPQIRCQLLGGWKISAHWTANRKDGQSARCETTKAQQRMIIQLTIYPCSYHFIDKDILLPCLFAWCLLPCLSYFVIKNMSTISSPFLP